MAVDSHHLGDARGMGKETEGGWNINFIFPYIGNNHPNWLIFFRGVQSTNQFMFDCLTAELMHLDQIPWPSLGHLDPFSSLFYRFSRGSMVISGTQIASTYHIRAFARAMQGNIPAQYAHIWYSTSIVGLWNSRWSSYVPFLLLNWALRWFISSLQSFVILYHWLSWHISYSHDLPSDMWLEDWQEVTLLISRCHSQFHGKSLHKRKDVAQAMPENIRDLLRFRWKSSRKPMHIWIHIRGVP